MMSWRKRSVMVCYTELRAIPRGDCDLLGLGVSAISMLGDAYSAKNQKELNVYYEQVTQLG